MVNREALQLARRQVIEAGHKLVKSGLIARTWGNISCRVDEDFFVITASGRPYHSLSEEEIVLVKIADVSYSSDIKPSSEKGIHAAVYRNKPQVGFVIHTHQINASALSTLNTNIVVGEPWQELLGKEIPIAAYALPGTKSLKKNVEKVLQTSSASALIMSYHGVVCYAQNEAMAFQVAQALEEAAQAYLFSQASLLQTVPTQQATKAVPKNQKPKQETKKKIVNWSGFYSLFLQAMRQDLQSNVYIKKDKRKNKDTPIFLNSLREKDFFILYQQKISDKGKKDTHNMQVETNAKKVCRLCIASVLYEPQKAKQELGFVPKASVAQTAAFWHEVRVHAAIYNADKKIEAIVHTHNADVISVAASGVEVFPFLDDFAQIVGTSAKSLVYEKIFQEQALKKTLARRKAFFLFLPNGCGGGAYTWGKTDGTSLDDAQAAAMVLQKNCRAFMVSSLLSHAKPINFWESLLMYLVYLLKYSRQAY